MVLFSPTVGWGKETLEGKSASENIRVSRESQDLFPCLSRPHLTAEENEAQTCLCGSPDLDRRAWPSWGCPRLEGPARALLSLSQDLANTSTLRALHAQDESGFL